MIPSFSPLVGGAERQAQVLAKALIERGLDVFVVTRRVPNTDRFDEIDGIKVFRTFSQCYPVGFLLSVLSFLFRHREGYDVIHVHTLDSPAVAAVVAGRLLRKVVIAKARSGRNIEVLVRKPIRSKWLVRGTDFFVAVSSALDAQLGVVGVDRAKRVIIPNCVDTTEFAQVSVTRRQEIRAELRLPVSGLIAVSVGRLIAVKETHKIVEAWAGVVDAHPAALLVIVGCGAEEGRLRSLARDMGIGSRVFFAGKRSHVETRKYLQAADVFVLASRTEGLSNALLEAASVGLVPVVSGIEANKEVVRDGENGLLFGSTQELTEKILCCASDRDMQRRLGAAARADVSARFSVQAVVEDLVRLYETSTP